MRWLISFSKMNNSLVFLCIVISYTIYLQQCICAQDFFSFLVLRSRHLLHEPGHKLSGLSFDRIQQLIVPQVARVPKAFDFGGYVSADTMTRGNIWRQLWRKLQAYIKRNSIKAERFSANWQNSYLQLALTHQPQTSRHNIHQQFGRQLSDAGDVIPNGRVYLAQRQQQDSVALVTTSPVHRSSNV
jgi:hypothetical protein